MPTSAPPVYVLRVTEPEADLLRDALFYWRERLDVTVCESAPHKAAGKHVRKRICELIEKLDEILP